MTYFFILDTFLFLVICEISSLLVEVGDIKVEDSKTLHADLDPPLLP